MFAVGKGLALGEIPWRESSLDDRNTGMIGLVPSARLPQQNDLRNFLMSQECAEMVQMLANLR